MDKYASLKVAPAESCAPTEAGLSTRLLIILTLLGAVTPFAADIYLPAFPQITTGLLTSPAGVQLSLTTFLVGAALGQFFFGPLSDRYGRILPIIIGTLFCAVTSVATALSPNIHFLITARFFQGVAGAAGMVVGRAIISDLSKSKEEAARAFSLMMSVIGFMPIVAPWLGSVIVGPCGWRGTLWAIVGFNLIVLCLVLLFVRESHKPARRALQPANGISLQSLLCRKFLGNTFALVFVFAAMMGFISASPFLLQTMIGLSVKQYGVVFAIIAAVLPVAGVKSAHLAAKVPPHKQLRISLTVLLAASFALLGIVFLGLPLIWTIIPIVIAMGSVGFSLGNATSCALAAVPKAVGAGSAILGALQFGFAALAAPLVGIRGERSAYPLAIVMTSAAALALVAFLFAEKKQPQTFIHVIEHERAA
jgi:DHA1 family bicyclomycin/chloramphenicol resistance-like MFS transporter